MFRSDFFLWFCFVCLVRFYALICEVCDFDLVFRLDFFFFFFEAIGLMLYYVV